MQKRILVVLCLVFGCMAAQAATSTDTEKALRKLDEAAKRFHNATADFTSDQKQTYPIPDEEKQTGKSAFARNADGVEMAAHFLSDNGRPLQKDLVYAKGELKMYEPKIDQLTVFTAGANRGMYESFLTLGFGGSGTELEKSWTVSYAGTDKVDGFDVVKLDLVSKLASVRDNYTRVTLWLDLNLGVSRKQLFFQKDGSTRTVEYTNIQVNQKSFPPSTFAIKKGSKVVAVTK